MHALSAYQVAYGADSPRPATHELRAGPVTALLDGIDLRYVRSGSLEVVRRVYMAVRDANWNTIPGSHRILRLKQEAESFVVEFEVEHRTHELDFAWHGRIVGSKQGEIFYEMDGSARSEFRYNRIGLCILHPFKACAGQPYTAHTPQGEVSGQLPELIGPQRFEGGFYVPLFPACDSLIIDLPQGVRAIHTFAGDLFEMEDQRNWTDASFKTYCTPLSLGFPHEAQPGRRITQRFTIRLEGTPEKQVVETPRITPGQPSGRLPMLGFALNSDGAPLTERELARLRSLRPDHLRIDLHLQRDSTTALRQAIETCQALGCQLEIAVFLTLEMGRQLDELATYLASQVKVARFLVFNEGMQSAQPTETTSPELLTLARQHLQGAFPGVVFAGGTDMYFCELNRTRPQAEIMDAVAYTIIPQAHAFDERSLAETLEAQAETVKSAQAFARGRPIVISPITLKRRYNPHATTSEVTRASDELPDMVDARQMSLFGAAWTAGSLKYLAESGADSLTYYELSGWLGLMEREAGSPSPERFPSAPGMVFPLYHVFADIAEWKEAVLLPCSSNQPLTVAGLAVESQGQRHLLVFNLTAEQQHTEIASLAGAYAELRSLDTRSAQEAFFEPEAFRQHRERVAIPHGTLALDLAPYATVRIDLL